MPVSGLRFHRASFSVKLEEEHQNLTKEMIEELALQARAAAGKTGTGSSGGRSRREPSGRKTEKCRGKF